MEEIALHRLGGGFYFQGLGVCDPQVLAMHAAAEGPQTEHLTTCLRV